MGMTGFGEGVLLYLGLHLCSSSSTTISSSTSTTNVNVNTNTNHVEPNVVNINVCDTSLQTAVFYLTICGLICFSTQYYLISSHLNYDIVKLLLLPILIGTIIGIYIAPFCDAPSLKKLLGIVFLFSGFFLYSQNKTRVRRQSLELEEFDFDMKNTMKYQYKNVEEDPLKKNNNKFDDKTKIFDDKDHNNKENIQSEKTSDHEYNDGNSKIQQNEYTKNDIEAQRTETRDFGGQRKMSREEIINPLPEKFSAKFDIHHPNKRIHFTCIGLFCGLLAGLFGTGGPPLMILVSLYNIGKDEFRASAALVWFLDNVLRFIYLYFIDQSIDFNKQGNIVLILIIGSFVGVFVGDYISKFLNLNLFRQLLIGIMFLGAFTMLFGNISFENIVIYLVVLVGINFTMNYSQEIINIWPSFRNSENQEDTGSQRNCFPYSFAPSKTVTVSTSQEGKKSFQGVRYHRVSMVAEENENEIEI